MGMLPLSFLYQPQSAPSVSQCLPQEYKVIAGTPVIVSTFQAERRRPVGKQRKITLPSRVSPLLETFPAALFNEFHLHLTDHLGVEKLSLGCCTVLERIGSWGAGWGDCSECQVQADFEVKTWQIQYNLSAVLNYHDTSGLAT